MPRLTRLLPDGATYALDSAMVLACDGGLRGEAVAKLAAFENMQEHIRQSVAAIPAELAALKAQGKEKTVRFRELAAQKFTSQAWLEMAEDFGVVDTFCHSYT